MHLAQPSRSEEPLPPSIDHRCPSKIHCQLSQASTSEGWHFACWQCMHLCIYQYEFDFYYQLSHVRIIHTCTCNRCTHGPIYTPHQSCPMDSLSIYLPFNLRSLSLPRATPTTTWSSWWWAQRGRERPRYWADSSAASQAAPCSNGGQTLPHWGSSWSSGGAGSALLYLCMNTYMYSIYLKLLCMYKI